MNISEQLQPGDGGGDAMAGVTVDDLIRELKTRCTACVVAMLVDDEDGCEQVIVNYQGGRVTCIGLMVDAQAKMVDQGVEECKGGCAHDLDFDDDDFGEEV